MTEKQPPFEQKHRTDQYFDMWALQDYDEDMERVLCASKLQSKLTLK